MKDRLTGHGELSDEELVQAFREGKEWAFNEIVNRYSRKILNLCTYFLKDRDQAYDISQEVFLKAYNGLRNFRGAARFSTWLHTIAVNTCKNRLSFLKRLFERKRRYCEDPLTHGHLDGPEEEVWRSRRRKIVRREIMELPAIHRDVLVLKDIQGLSYEEICSVLCIGQGTVKSRLHRAREALAKRLEAAFGDDGW